MLCSFKYFLVRKSNYGDGGKEEYNLLIHPFPPCIPSTAFVTSVSAVLLCQVPNLGKSSRGKKWFVLLIHNIQSSFICFQIVYFAEGDES